jgi:diguanylate cyclase (GGDEF)-like protein
VDPAPPATAVDQRWPLDELAKAWLVGVIERTPLERVAEVDLDLLVSEAGPLIAGILNGLEPNRELSADTVRRARELTRLRHGDGAQAEIQRDFAVLQSVLVASLDRDGPSRRPADFAQAVRRLAEIFGSVHGAAAEGLVHHRGRGGSGGEVTPSTEDAELRRWLDVLLAVHGRYGHPFALALVRVDGLGAIDERYGHRSSEVMRGAVGTVIRNQIRIVDRSFRLGEDGFCVLAPNADAGRLRPMADRLVRVVETSQAPHGPRVAISAGVSACPEHGHEPGHLLAAAEEAIGGARAVGAPVEIAASGAPPVCEKANGTYQKLR